MMEHWYIGIAWYCMVLHGIELYCMVLHSIAWYYMVLHGVAWYYMVGEYQNCPTQKCPLEGNFEAGNSEYAIHQNCPPYFFFVC